MRNREPLVVPWEGPRPVQVDWGSRHSLVLDEEGGVWEAGLSRSQTTSQAIQTFQRAKEIPPATFVSAGYFHSVALDTNGTLWVWTSCNYQSWSSLAMPIANLHPIVRVAGGINFLLAEDDRGDIWVIGNSPFGHSALESKAEVSVPTLVVIPGRSEGPLRCLGALQRGALLIDSQGFIWTAGNRYMGGLGRSGTKEEFKKVEGIPPMAWASCGYKHVLALDELGRVWTWGAGRDGQLGTEEAKDQTKPTHLAPVEGAIGVLAGYDHYLVFLANGDLLVFGWNHCGQLGFPSKTGTRQLTPSLSSLLPALPYPAPSRQKSARFKDRKVNESSAWHR